MSRKRKRPTSDPRPPMHYRGHTLEQLAAEIGGDRARAFDLLRHEVLAGTAVRLRVGRRVLFARGGARFGRRLPAAPLAGWTADQYARAVRLALSDAGRELTAARDRGDVIELRSAGEIRYSRLAGGIVTEVTP